MNAPRDGASVSRLHGRPTAEELLEAVEEFLRGPMSDEVSGTSRFHARVAANVVAMVRRELAVSVAEEAWYSDAVAALGFDDDAALAAAIREDRIRADRYADVTNLVRAAVQRRVDVAQPGYREG